MKALSQRPDGTWDVITDRDDHVIHAEHVVNAGGLWAREVGRMCGLELPVLAMEHHYLMTEPMPEVIEYNQTHGRELPHMIDFAGEIYARQEGNSILLGTYEQDNRVWAAEADAVGLRVPAAPPRPRPHLARARARRSSTSRPSAAPASRSSSTARSRSAPTATRSSARSRA